MGARTTVSKCTCAACGRFNVDAAAIVRGVRQLHRLDPAVVKGLETELYLGNGCDLCGRDALRVPFVPQIIKDFLRIEYLCEWCRNRIDYQRRSLKWPICWGSTPDDELKWFLLHDALRQFNLEVRGLSPAAIAKEHALQAWLDSLPEVEYELVQELEITLKRRGETTPPARSA